jgi:hypothetical protein
MDQPNFFVQNYAIRQYFILGPSQVFFKMPFRSPHLEEKNIDVTMFRQWIGGHQNQCWCILRFWEVKVQVIGKVQRSLDWKF